MKRRVRDFDWASTPLGARSAWPLELETAVQIMLESRYAMWLGWGESLIFLYNDAYARMTLGPKHPWALGRPASEVWPEVWDVAGPRASSALHRGEATWDENLLLFLDRSGFPEETYHTFSYSPIPGPKDTIGGMLCVVTEETKRVIGERRLKTLTELSARLSSGIDSTLTACEGAATVLAENPDDFPFIALFLRDEADDVLRRITTTGLADKDAVVPLHLAPDASDPWPLTDLETAGEILVDDLQQRFPGLRTRGKNDLTRCAVLLLLRTPAQPEGAGLLILGLSSRLHPDNDYLGFCRLVSGHIAAALSNAQSRHAEQQRLEAIASLAESEARFRSMADYAPVVVWVTEPDGSCSYINETWYETSKQSGDGHLKFSWLGAIHPEDRAYSVRVFSEAVAVQTPFRMEYRIRHRDGSYRWAIDSARPRFSGNGTFLGFVGSIVDVTELKQAEASRRASEQQLRIAQRAGKTGIFEWNIPEGRIIWSPELESLYGLPEGGFEGRLEDWKKRVHPEDVDRVVAELEHCIREMRTHITYEFRMLLPDEGSRWLAGQAQFFYSAEGEVLRMIGVNVDIDELKKAETALERSRADFRTLADNISQFAWSADPCGWITWYNQRWYDYTGTTLEQMQGWGWQQVHHPEHVEAVTREFKRCISAGIPWEDTFPLRGQDGSYRWFLSRAQPIFDAEGKVERWFGTNTDITEQRHAEEALKDADRRKDEFLATLAHELRNPLAPLRTGLEVVRLANYDSSVVAKVHSTLERQTEQMVRLIDDLMDVSRITRGRLELRRKRVELEEVVQSAIEATRPLLDANRHHLEVSLPTESTPIHADPHRLAQILANLLNNAAKYTPSGGQIRLAAERNGTELLISVKDNGIGIPNRERERIFEMFAQVERSPQELSSGLGIGLTLVKSLVEMHRGQIEVTSAGPALGSEFRLRLPILVRIASPQRTDHREKQEPETQKRKLLVVDDNRDAALSLSMLLEMLGNDVRTAYDGVEALDVAREFQPEFVLLDLGMPKLNGYETAKRLRNTPWGQRMVLIALTGWGQEDDRRRTRDAGFDHHLVKPAHPDVLQRIIVESLP
ncbi:MAG: PAS domain-containing protein [Bdellovibrionales bacterium]|nr:PAS domain-containing protein [Bdellovibrionales bacterium]